MQRELIFYITEAKSYCKTLKKHCGGKSLVNINAHGPENNHGMDPP